MSELIEPLDVKIKPFTITYTGDDVVVDGVTNRVIECNVGDWRGKVHLPVNTESSEQFQIGELVTLIYYMVADHCEDNPE